MKISPNDPHLPDVYPHKWVGWQGGFCGGVGWGRSLDFVGRFVFAWGESVRHLRIVHLDFVV